MLDIMQADDGALYFAAFTGGIDCVKRPASLMDGTARFSNRNARDGLDADFIQSVGQDSGGDFWVAARQSLSRYNRDWKHIATYNGGNVGRDFTLTEAKPQILNDGRMVFGMSGGLLSVTPGATDAATSPALVITGIDLPDGKLHGVPPSGRLTLPSGCRDMAVHFAALAFGSNANIEYAYRLGEDSEWTPLGKERVVRLPSLPSGSYPLQIRCTDRFGSWTDRSVSIRVDVPRSWHEIAGDAAIVLVITLGCALGVIRLRKALIRRRRARKLEAWIRLALDGQEAAAGSDGFMAAVCRAVHEGYGDSALRAESVGRAAGMGRNDLRRSIKAELGISIEDFIRAVRIRAAASLLAQRRLSVAETAYRCGFTTPQYMAMVFKEHYGCTPSEYADNQSKKVVSN